MRQNLRTLILFKEQKEKQEVGFTKQNVEQLIAQATYEKMSK